MPDILWSRSSSRSTQFLKNSPINGNEHAITNDGCTPFNSSFFLSVKLCQRADPNERPSANEAKQSIWLNMRLTSSVRTATEHDMDAAACSLENYSMHKTLQKLALMVIAHKSNSEEIGYLRNVFKRYDKDRDGSITLNEFKRCLSKYKYPDEYVVKLFNAAVGFL